MSRYKGTFLFGANLEGGSTVPIDARQLVGEYADLVLPATWCFSPACSTMAIYDGMIVGVGGDSTPANNGVYWLCDAANYTGTTSWVKVGEGGGTSNLSGATNGLSLFSGDTYVGLGGDLITGTTINTDGNQLNITSGATTFLSVLPATDIVKFGTAAGAVMCLDADDEFYAEAGDSCISMYLDDIVFAGPNAGICTKDSTNTLKLLGTTYIDTTPTGGTTSDDVLVRNSSFGEVKIISVTDILDGAITSANNGLCASGQVVSLGGDLTGATSISIISGTSLTFTDTRTTTSGITYGGDYEDDFAARSLVTAQYVTGITSGLTTSGITSANNGLCANNQIVSLGGDLTGDTTISGAHILTLSGLTAFNACATNIGLTGIVGVTGAVCLSSTLVTAGATALRGSLNVTGATTLGNTLTLSTVAAGAVSNPIMVLDGGVVKCVTASSFDVTASNGLTASGNNVKLGGTLVTGNTLIAINGYTFEICSSTGNKEGLCISADGNCSAFGNVGTLTGEGFFCIDTKKAYVCGNEVCISNCDNQQLYFSSTGMEITDTNLGKGLINAGNYESGFTARSLVTAQFVTGITSGITGAFTTANNGLCANNQIVSLGGPLTGDTTISGAHILALSGLTAFNACATNIGLTGAVCLSSTLTTVGATALKGGLNVTGATTLTATTVGGTLTLSSVASGDTSDALLVLDSTGAVQCMAQSDLDVVTGAINVGSGQEVYSGQTGSTSIFRTIVGSGGTQVQKVGNEIIITSNTASGSQQYSGETPSAVDLCGISIGYQLTGKTVSCIIQDLLVPELFGSITTPSLSISLTHSGIREIGCNISQTVQGTFNQGCINPQYCSLSDKRSGLPNAYCFTGSGMPSGFQACATSPASQTNASYDVISGSQTWSVCTRYDAGSPALGSKDTQYCAALISGCTNASSSSITGILPWYWGTNVSGTLTGADITGGTKTVANVSQSTPITFNAVTEYLWFAAPTGAYTTKTKWWVCAANAGNIGGTGEVWAAACTVAVTSGQGCWSGCSFDVYVTCGITTTDPGIPMCLYY